MSTSHVKGDPSDPLNFMNPRAGYKQDADWSEYYQVQRLIPTEYKQKENNENCFFFKN